MTRKSPRMYGGFLLCWALLQVAERCRDKQQPHDERQVQELSPRQYRRDGLPEPVGIARAAIDTLDANLACPLMGSNKALTALLGFVNPDDAAHAACSSSSGVS